MTDTVRTRLDRLETTGLPSAITATAVEINAKCDRTFQLNSIIATTAITQAVHEGKRNVITGSGVAEANTLPPATGSGDVYEFIMGQVNTSGTTFVTNAPASVSMYGSINLLDVDAAAQAAYFTVTAGGTDTVTFNGTTTGGQIGDFVRFIDIAVDKWMVFGQGRVPAGSNPANPFSSAA